MTHGDAHDLNVLLSWLLGRQVPTGRLAGQAPTAAQAREAATRLADRAARRLAVHEDQDARSVSRLLARPDVWPVQDPPALASDRTVIEAAVDAWDAGLAFPGDAIRLIKGVLRGDPITADIDHIRAGEWEL